MTDPRDITALRRAITLARARLGATGDNPAVGCVIVLDGQTVAEAATAPGGRPHAEEQAIDLAGTRCVGATAYVSLEPCGERSSGAASCAERLAAAHVARVVYAAANPDPRSAGRGPNLLRAAGVVVDGEWLSDEAADVYTDFLALHEKGGARAGAASS